MPGDGVHPWTKWAPGIIGVPGPVNGEQRFLNDILRAIRLAKPISRELSHELRDFDQEHLVSAAITILSSSHELREPPIEVRIQDYPG